MTMTPQPRDTPADEGARPTPPAAPPEPKEPRKMTRASNRNRAPLKTSRDKARGHLSADEEADYLGKIGRADRDLGQQP